MEKWQFSVRSPRCVNSEVWNLVLAWEAAWGVGDLNWEQDLGEECIDLLSFVAMFFIKYMTKWLLQPRASARMQSESITDQIRIASRLAQNGDNNMTVLFWRGVWRTIWTADSVTWSLPPAR